MNKYIKAFSLGLQSSMEYRWNFMLGLVSFIFPVIIQVFLWSGIFANSGGGMVYGYTYSQMIAYSVFAALVGRLVSGGLEWEVMDDIKNGGLSKFIIKPIGYLQYRAACFLGDKSINSIIIYIIIAVFLFVFNINMGLAPRIENLLFFLLTILLSLLINFLIYFSLAAIAFWINEAWGVFVILGVVVNIISGGVFPLDIFGDTLIKVFSLLPFQYTIYFSVNVLCGRFSINGILPGLLVQVVWIFILFGITVLIWKAGMKKYTAVGG